jgi:FtsP/CotA-like multicopper oxidase with cupredoxin domain
MTNHSSSGSLSRRDFLKLAGGAAVLAAGASLAPQTMRKVLRPTSIAQAADTAPHLYFAGTDGWIYLPPNPPIGFYFPDDLAPAPFNTYIFGFRNITGLDDTQKANQKMHAQHSAPMFWVNQEEEFRLQLTNLGLQMRPDLTDSHTLHWHGFRNVITFFDGEPTGSVSVPIGRDFTYVFRPHEPGTYMYHCHVEDVEHVHMGMTGPVFVRPLQNSQDINGYTKFAYNDGDGSTGYDREFVMFLSEVWAEAHWCDSHIQLPDWSDYRADFSLLNGRVYPDTLEPNAPIDAAQSVNALAVQRDADGYLIPPAGRSDLQYQPLSALVTCQPGERVLLRFSNLGFREASMTLAGIPMRVVGRDATLMRGLNAAGMRGNDKGDPGYVPGADTSYVTDTVLIGAGESFDIIFTAPAFSGESGSSGQGYDAYVLYNRRYGHENNLAGGSGGQRTEVRVYPGDLAPQQYPNDWGIV